MFWFPDTFDVADRFCPEPPLSSTIDGYTFCSAIFFDVDQPSLATCYSRRSVSQMTVQPFKLEVPQPVLDDLKSRLAHTRWPDDIDSAGWDFGTDLEYLKALVDYWQHTYNWSKQESEINKFVQFRAEID